VWPYTQFTKEPPWEKDFRDSPLVSTGGFLDDSLYDRTSYILDQRHSARKIAFCDEMLVGLRWDEPDSRMLLHNHLFQLDRDRYTIFARRRSPAGSEERRESARPDRDLWSREIDIRPSAMAMTGDAVFVAGVPLHLAENPSADSVLRSIRGEAGSTLLRLSRDDGTPSQVCEFSSLPVWDGIAVGRHGLFLTLQDGEIVCLR
jgi:hypothetical protein